MKDTTIDLPSILESYYQAKNAHDVDAMAECFAENALVNDEHEDIHGKVAIRNWIAKTTEQYRVKVDVREVNETGAEVAVTALVSGNFDGSPLEMYYSFTLDGGRIAKLSIDA